MTDIHLTSRWQRARGVIGRYPSANERYIFEFDTVVERGVHMLGVTRPLEVSFYVDGTETHRTVLAPWTGTAAAECNRIIERQPQE